MTSYTSFAVQLESLETGSGTSDFSCTDTITNCDQNNTGTQTTRTRNLIINPSADIQVNQTINNTTPKQGDYVTITINVKTTDPTQHRNHNKRPNTKRPIRRPNRPTNQHNHHQRNNIQPKHRKLDNTNTNQQNNSNTNNNRTSKRNNGTTITNRAYKTANTQYDWQTGNNAIEKNILITN